MHRVPECSSLNHQTFRLFLTVAAETDSRSRQPRPLQVHQDLCGEHGVSGSPPLAEQARLIPARSQSLSKHHHRDKKEDHSAPDCITSGEEEGDVFGGSGVSLPRTCVRLETQAEEEREGTRRLSTTPRRARTVRAGESCAALCARNGARHRSTKNRRRTILVNVMA